MDKSQRFQDANISLPFYLKAKFQFQILKSLRLHFISLWISGWDVGKELEEHFSPPTLLNGDWTFSTQLTAPGSIYWTEKTFLQLNIDWSPSLPFFFMTTIWNYSPMLMPCLTPNRTPLASQEQWTVQHKDRLQATCLRWTASTFCQLCNVTQLCLPKLNCCHKPHPYIANFRLNFPSAVSAISHVPSYKYNRLFCATVLPFKFCTSIIL